MNKMSKKKLKKLILVITISLIAPANRLSRDGSNLYKEEKKSTSTTYWKKLGRLASEFVSNETPLKSLPYDHYDNSSLRPTVVAHYFPPFPLSLDGIIKNDYYQREYLKTEGEGGKHRSSGGYLRVRPLPGPIGYRYDYRKLNLAVEVARAARIGIDAFGVDLLTIDVNSPLWQTSLDLLDAAQAVPGSFRIVPEPDLGSLPAETSVEQLADALTKFAQHPSGFRTSDGRLLVMPFAAELRTSAWWTRLVKEMDHRGLPVALVPVFLDRKTLPSFLPIVAGASVWGDRYATAATANIESSQAARAAGVKRWFMPVSVQDYRPKSHVFTESRNSDSWRAQWDSVLVTQSDGVHLVTWNDYSENTQIAPTYPDGFGTYDLTGYFIALAKRGGSMPVKRDAAYLVHRNQILRLDAGEGAPLILAGPTPLTNDIEAIVLLKRPATIALSVGTRRLTVEGKAGLSSLRLKAALGRVVVRISRPGDPGQDLIGKSEVLADPTIQDATYRIESLSRRVSPAY